MLATTNSTYEVPALHGRDSQISALGTWDGATVTLEAYQDGAWRPVPNGAYTDDFEIVRTNGPATRLRLVVTDADTSTALSLNITEVTQ
jgi:hypothetical protein